MQTLLQSEASALSPELEALIERKVAAAVEAERGRDAQRPKKMAIICSKGTLDQAYPPLILATTAAAYGWEAGVFFTSYGLNIIHRQKSKRLQVAPLGNPAMPVPMPNILGMLPGMTFLATTMMERMCRQHGMASIPELLDIAVESGVKLFPCGTSVRTFGYTQEDFVPGVEPISGAASFVSFGSDASVTLFV